MSKRHSGAPKSSRHCKKNEKESVTKQKIATRGEKRGGEKQKGWVRSQESDHTQGEEGNPLTAC
jgi:hypothetical protein